uniref:protein disulfide-isomerase n=1 Tax=Esox lucius TaxID=8010 RepID=A0AAY5KR56_ESOLU
MTANKKLFLVSTVSFTVLLNIATASAYVEELDDRFKNTRRADEIWLIEFYAPWCTFCQQLDPVWYEIGAELKSMGSPISVGKVDADVHRSLAKEFRVTDYPAIKLWKDDLKYNYRGPRTKEAIMDFADRVSGPVVRALPSQQLFQNVMSRHDVLFVYVGGTSDLKKYFSAAKELIVHTYFFSATRHILPKAVTLEEYPAVVVFKEGTYFLYNEQQDGELVSWINRERFLSYLTFDSYTLYAMGDTGMTISHTHTPNLEAVYKTLMQRAATEYKDFYSREFQFGHMDGNLYINGIIMDELAMPAIIALNMSNDGYFLPPNKVETMEQLVKFLDAVSKGRIRAPLLGALLFFVFGFVGSTFCFVLYKSCEMVRSRMREEREEAEALQSPGRDKNTETRKNPSEKKAD